MICRWGLQVIHVNIWMWSNWPFYFPASLFLVWICFIIPSIFIIFSPNYLCSHSIPLLRRMLISYSALAFSAFELFYVDDKFPDMIGNLGKTQLANECPQGWIKVRIYLPKEGPRGGGWWVKKKRELTAEIKKNGDQIQPFREQSSSLLSKLYPRDSSWTPPLAGVSGFGRASIVPLPSSVSRWALSHLRRSS